MPTKSKTKPKKQRYTVIATEAGEGTFRVFYALATDPLHAFGVVAKREREMDLEFLVAIPGTVKEGVDFFFPGEGIVVGETVREQKDVFGPQSGDSI